MERGFQGARRRAARLRLRLDDLLLLADYSGQQPGHANRGRMANRCRYSRRPDQCASDKADELPHIPVQHFSKRPPRLHLRHSAADRADLYLFPRLHRVAFDPMVYVLATVSLLMAGLIQFFITYSLAMMAFWILEISTIVFIVYSFEYFLGGQMFPIDIMPPAVQAVMKWLPFYYELFAPIAIFLGRLQGAALAQALVIQTGWLFLAWAWANYMWKRGLGHYQAVGG